MGEELPPPRRAGPEQRSWSSQSQQTHLGFRVEGFRASERPRSKEGFRGLRFRVTWRLHPPRLGGLGCIPSLPNKR